MPFFSYMYFLVTAFFCLCVETVFASDESPSISISRSQVSKAIALDAAARLRGSDSVIQLTDENFDNTVFEEKKFTVVLYHAPFSARSNKFMIEFVATAESYADNNEVVFAVLDCPHYEKIARANEIISFPSVRMYTHGIRNHYNVYPAHYYNQAELSEFVDRIMLHEKFKVARRDKAAEDERRRLKHPSQGDVVELNDTNFDNFTKSTAFFTFVLFYTPWCQSCKDLEGVLKDVAHYFRTDPFVIIGRINVDTYSKFADRYRITSFPTMYMFPKARLSKRGIYYHGAREQVEMRSIIDMNNAMSDNEMMPYIDENTDMEALTEEMKAKGLDPESLMKKKGTF